jgi:LysR family transcriptional regulator, cell division regulator
VDSNDLRVFAAVAASGSMNRAADELYTVQSNVTRQIHRLEQDLGTALFGRHSRGVELTDAGRRLLPYALAVGRTLHDAAHAARDEGKPVGSLIIGSLETTAAIRLPPVLAAFTRAYPGVDLTLATNTTAGLVSQVLAHQLDGAFVCGPIAHPDLEEREVFVEELVLATAPHIRTIADLTRETELRMVVFRVGCSYRQILEAWLAARGVAARRTLEFGTVDGILGCVAASIGVTLLPRSVVQSAADEGRVVIHELPLDEARVSTVFIRRTDRFRGSALTAFLDTTRRHYSKSTGEGAIAHHGKGHN